MKSNDSAPGFAAMAPASPGLEWALTICGAARLRITPVREKVLGFLAIQPAPVTLEAVTGADGIRGEFDGTTVYRTLMLFVGLELVRQIRFRKKLSYFVLNEPGRHLDYLICRRCGSVHPLPEIGGMEQIEHQVSSAHGYSGVHHELGVYGICPQCQSDGQTSIPINKIPARFYLE